MSQSMDDTTNPSTAPLVRSHRSPGPRTYTPMLICVEGLQAGARFPINKSENIIGRTSSADVYLQDDMASRRHARITYKNVGHTEQPPICILEDLNSRNGTDLNGESITGERQLNERDRILVGSSLLGFFLRDEKEMENDQLLYEMATRDSLTGLDNRHQFKTHLRLQVERARRYGQCVSLLVLDCDLFKLVNDKYGHDVGDKALLHVARQIEACCRSSELCARWGGEEFVVLAPDTDRAAATALAERIRSTIESNPLKYLDAPIPLSVSIGVAEMGVADDSDNLFRNADQNLLKAKQLGRNRVNAG